MVAVPGDVRLGRRLEVRRDARGVETAEHRVEQLPAQPFAVARGLDADHRQVPVRLLRVQLLGLLQVTEPVAKRVRCEQRLPRGDELTHRPASRRRVRALREPTGGADDSAVVDGRPDFSEREPVAHDRLQEAARRPPTATRRGVEVAEHGIVVEGTSQFRWRDVGIKLRGGRISMPQPCLKFEERERLLRVVQLRGDGGRRVTAGRRRPDRGPA